MARITESEQKDFAIVDRPKRSLRVIAIGIWGVSIFVLYKVVSETPQPVIWLSVLAVCAVCTCVVLREFLIRPERRTIIRAGASEVVITETAPWHNRQTTVAITRTTRFEVFRCESDNDIAHGVRIAQDQGEPLIVAEYLSKDEAERLATAANEARR